MSGDSFKTFHSIKVQHRASSALVISIIIMTLLDTWTVCQMLNLPGKKGRMCIASSESKTGSTRRGLNEYWHIIQGAGERMRLISRVWVGNGRSPLRATELTGGAPPQQISESFLSASPPNTLLLMLPDGWVNLGDAFWKPDRYHAEFTQSLDWGEFNSTCSDVLLTSVGGLMCS